MNNKILPVQFKEIKNGFYAGFWIRLAAFILDFLIWIPVFAIIEYLNSLNRFVYFFTIIPYLFSIFLFEVYLVKRYGGTPGKLIVGIKIIKKNAEDADWKAAILRYCVSLIFSIICVYFMINL